MASTLTHPEPIAAVAPRFLCPAGLGLVRDVVGFPAEVAARLHDSFGIDTLDDLAEHVRVWRDAGTLPGGPLRAAFENLKVPAPHLEQAVFAMLLHCSTAERVAEAAPTDTPTPAKKPRTRKPKADAAPPQACGCPAVVGGVAGGHRPNCAFVAETLASGHHGVTVEQWAAKRKRPEPAPAPVPPPAPAADDTWDEGTPPPRVPPRGVPAPKVVVMAPGETAEHLFLTYSQSGGVPPGSVLARFVGCVEAILEKRDQSVSGWVFALNGQPIPPALFQSHRVVTWLLAKGPGGQVWQVLASAGGAA